MPQCDKFKQEVAYFSSDLPDSVIKYLESLIMKDKIRLRRIIFHKGKILSTH